MWMVVSEGPNGRIRYQYHNLAPVAPSVYQSLDPYARGFGRGGCMSFPEASYLTSPTSTSMTHHHNGGGQHYHEVEQYDNVSNHNHNRGDEFVSSYATYGAVTDSSNSSSSGDYQEPVYKSTSLSALRAQPSSTRGKYASANNGNANGRRRYVGVYADPTFYYYQDRQTFPMGSEDMQVRVPSPDYSPPLPKHRVRFQLPGEKPSSRGLFVSNSYTRSRRVLDDDDNDSDTYDELAVGSGFDIVSLDPDPQPKTSKVLVHRGGARGGVSVHVSSNGRTPGPTTCELPERTEDPIYAYFSTNSSSSIPKDGSLSGSTSSKENYARLPSCSSAEYNSNSSSNSASSSVSGNTPPPLPPHPPALHRLNRNKNALVFGAAATDQGVAATPSRGFEITQAYAPPSRNTGPIVLSGGAGGITHVGTTAHAQRETHSNVPEKSSGGGLFGSSKKSMKKKDKKPKIRKEDISNPTNFQHKAHVGWDQDNGFSNKVYDSADIDEATENVLRAAGVQPEKLNASDMRFAQKFVAKNYDKYVSLNGLSASGPAPPPPIPQQPTPSTQMAPAWGSSNLAKMRPAYPSSAPIGSPAPLAPPRIESQGIAPARPPPPPPTAGGRDRAPSRPLPSVPQAAREDPRPYGVPPPPPPPPSVTIAPMGAPPPPPPPPPPPSLSSGAPPPPPPPPPPPANGGHADQQTSPPGRGNLLAEIQAGKQLKSVGSSASVSSTNSSGGRNDVMAQIRQGAMLKHVDAPVEQEKRKSATSAGMGGLAGALAKALEERRMNMGIDDSSESSDSEEKNEWSD